MTIQCGLKSDCRLGEWTQGFLMAQFCTTVYEVCVERNAYESYHLDVVMSRQ